jgi:hypothetical protein
MIRQDPPFELGETMPGTDDNSNLINDTWLGQKFEVPYQPLGSAQIRGSKKRQVGASVIAVPMRNESGITLYGKRLAKLDVSGGLDFFKNVTGYATDLAETNVVFIDEFLATSGVADDDIFWAIVSGPVITRLQGAANAGGTITVGAKLVSGTGSTSGNSTSGGLAADTTPRADEIVATALSAMNSASTGQDLLVNAHLLTL